MSEQQFGWNYFENEVVIGDKQDKKRMIVLVFSNFMDIPYNRKYIDELVDLLNEMSETIVEQQSFIGRKLLGFDKYLAERLNEEQEIIKEQENIIKQLDQKIKDKNEYQQVLESKIRRLKDRIKVLEK